MFLWTCLRWKDTEELTWISRLKWKTWQHDILSVVKSSNLDGNQTQAKENCEGELEAMNAVQGRLSAIFPFDSWKNVAYDS